MAVVAALATAETGHYEDENEHPQARRDETAQQLVPLGSSFVAPEGSASLLAGSSPTPTSSQTQPPYRLPLGTREST